MDIIDKQKGIKYIIVANFSPTAWHGDKTFWAVVTREKYEKVFATKNVPPIDITLGVKMKFKKHG